MNSNETIILLQQAIKSKEFKLNFKHIFISIQIKNYSFQTFYEKIIILEVLTIFK